MRLFMFIFIITLISCNKKTDKVSVKAPERPELSKDSKIFFGNRLFSEKTCITCHAVTKKKIGPSVVEIMRVYEENNASIVDFLKGKSKPIVDTDKEQIAIMQANIDGFLKEVTNEELDAISTYMIHVVELKNK